MAQGCYTPLYATGSFKGVTFDAMEVTSEHGRRGAEGEFPFSENTAYTDLGRKIRRYSISARFANNAHIASADALIAACESYGPGLLVHPTRGAVTVACTKLTVKDNPLEEQGVTYLDMEFVEANSIGTGVNVGSSLLGFAFGGIIDAIGEAFESNYDLDKVRYYRVNDVQSTVPEQLQNIRNEFARATHATNSAANWQALTTLDSVISDPAQYRSAEDTFEVFKRATRTLSGVTSGQDKYDAFRRIANGAASTSSLPDEAGVSQNAVYSTVRMLSMVHMVQGALETPVANLNEALDQYDAVVTIIDEELAAARATCDDDLYIKLREFQTNARSALLNRAYNLPAVVIYDFGGPVHSLVAAYEIFNDAKRFAEIESFNPGAWPFLVGPQVIATRS